jgi:hypothetical protein
VLVVDTELSPAALEPIRTGPERTGVREVMASDKGWVVAELRIGCRDMR